MPKERHKIVPASYLVLVKNDTILLSRRYNTGYEDGNYNLPAGHVERGETCTYALVREVKEEIGIVLMPQDVRVVHVMHRKSGNDALGERMDIFYVAKRWSGEIINEEPNKCDDISWFSLSNLPKNLTPYIRQALEHMQKEVFYSEFGWLNKS